MKITDPPRSAERRKDDVLSRLKRETDIWVATADDAGLPCLVPLWFVWHREAVWLSTRITSPTGRNLRDGGRARLALGDTLDVVLLDGEVTVFAPADVPETAAGALRGGGRGGRSGVGGRGGTTPPPGHTPRGRGGGGAGGAAGGGSRARPPRPPGAPGRSCLWRARSQECGDTAPQHGSTPLRSTAAPLDGGAAAVGGARHTQLLWSVPVKGVDQSFECRPPIRDSLNCGRKQRSRTRSGHPLGPVASQRGRARRVSADQLSGFARTALRWLNVSME